MNENTIIQVKGLTAKYEQRTILHDINFSINKGERFFILGESGSGKTTLFSHLIGLIQPFSGSIMIDGNNLTQSFGRTRQEILKKFGVMYQSGALFGSMSLLENVMLPLQELTDLNNDAIKKIAKNMLKLVGLGKFSGYMPGEISGGMQKRAAIARAMVLSPKILFLDEPSAGLDPITSKELDALILNLSTNLKITFVIVSHELRSIYRLATQAIILQDKKIIATGNLKELKQNHHPFVQQFLNEANQS